MESQTLKKSNVNIEELRRALIELAEYEEKHNLNGKENGRENIH
tara:strand:+ start:320 stop:451 length:132 start_codon:yes stop_codon:yes gene_type:complete